MIKMAYFFISDFILSENKTLTRLLLIATTTKTQLICKTEATGRPTSTGHFLFIADYMQNPW